MAGYENKTVAVKVVATPLPRAPWSATSIENFSGCPLRYWWSKVQRWQTPTTVPLLVGTAVHGALEELLALPTTDRTPVTGEPLLDQAVSTALAQVSDQPIDSAAVIEGARRAMGAYWDTEDPQSVDVAPDGIEREVSADINGLAFRGYIDRVAVTDVGLRVTDYKTGAPKPKYWWSYWRQQLLYAKAMSECGEPVAEVELLFLTSPRAVTRPVYPAAMQRAVDDLSRADDERATMSTDHRWEARTGPLCNWCDFRMACPAKRSRAPEPGTPESDEILRQNGLWQRRIHPDGSVDGATS